MSIKEVVKKFDYSIRISNRQIFMLVVFLSLCNLYSAQNNELDSLYNVVKTSENDGVIANAHGRICWLLININTVAAQAHMDTARGIFIRLNDAKGISIADYKDGVINRRTGNFDQALNDFARYMRYADSVGNQKMVNNGLFQQAVVYQQQGSFSNCLELFYQLLDYYKVENDVKGIGLILNSIGIAYENMEKFEDAERSFQESIDELIHSEFQDDLANSYGNIAEIYGLKGELVSSLEMDEKALEIYSRLKNNWGIAVSYLGIGGTYMKMGELSKAEEYAKKALAIQMENNYREKNDSHILLGKIFMKKGSLSESEKYLKMALSSNITVLGQKDVHEALNELFKLKHNDTQALLHYENFVQFKDSIAGIDYLKDINQLQYKFESSQKDKNLIEQNSLIQQQEIELLKKEARSTRNLILAIVSSFGLIFSLFYYRQRQRLKNKEIESLKINQELNKLESLIEGQEKERKRLAQDLHDGINGDLSVIKYKVTSTDKNKLNEEETREYNAAVFMLDKAIEQVRSISHDLAPPSLQSYNLVEAISEYCMKISSGSSLAISFQHFGKVSDLSSETETAIYRMVQELINNSVRHAKAKSVLVQINFHENDLHVSIEDDGLGYDQDKIKPGLGLNNIKSRAQFLGAEVHVDSSDKGTLTTIDINTKKLK